MTLFLRLTQILITIVILLSLPLVIFFQGWMLIPWGLMIALIVAIDKKITAIKNNVAVSGRLYRTYVITILLAGIVCAFLIYFVGGLGNLDATGEPSAAAYAVGFGVVFVYTAALLWVGHRRQQTIKKSRS